jgi:hypothetical protein
MVNKTKLAFLICLTIFLVSMARHTPFTLAVGEETGTVSPDWKAIMQTIADNPALIGALVALAWNFGGYITRLAQVRKIEKYEWLQLAESLALFETLFLILQGIGGLPAQWTVVISVTLAFIRSVKKAIAELLAKMMEASGAAPSSVT